MGFVYGDAPPWIEERPLRLLETYTVLFLIGTVLRLVPLKARTSHECQSHSVVGKNMEVCMAVDGPPGLARAPVGLQAAPPDGA